MGRFNKKTDSQEKTSHMANGQSQYSTGVLINNDQNFFSPIVSPNMQQETPCRNKSGKKYQDDVEITSMELKPTNNNDKIWTTGRNDEIYERKLRRKYHRKLFALAILLFMFIALIVVSAILFTYTKTEGHGRRGGSTLLRLAGTTARYKMSSQKPSATPKSIQRDHIKETISTHVSSFSTTSTKTSFNVTAISTREILRTSPATTTTRQDHDTNLALTTDFTALEREGLGTVTTIVTPSPNDEATSSTLAVDKDLVSDILTEVEMVTITPTTSNILGIQTSQSETLNSIKETPKPMTTSEERVAATVAYTPTITNVDVITMTDMTDIVSEIRTEDDWSTLSYTPLISESGSERSHDRTDTKERTSFPGGVTDVSSAISSISTHVATFLPGATSQITTTTAPTRSSIPGCQEIPVDACREALPTQRGTLTASNLRSMYTLYSDVTDLSTCHVDANRVVCTLYAQPCQTQFYFPCRSTCLEVASACFKESNPGLFNYWQDAFCNNLPESSDDEICFPPSHRVDNDSTNSCNDSYCLNNGTCFDLDGQPFCRCLHNQYAGTRCQIPFLDSKDVAEQNITIMTITDDTESEMCQSIAQEQCMEVLPYNQTLKLVVSGSPPPPAWDIVAPFAACSDTAKLLFCSEIYSELKCSPESRPPYIVCKNLCLEVKEQCLFLYTALGLSLDCNVYPDASPYILCLSSWVLYSV